jgi:hypothetical protein
MDKIVERIEREAGVPGLALLLAERLAPTDLQSLLLEVYRLRSRQRRPAEVLSSYETGRFVRPSSASPTRLLAWEQAAFTTLPPDFQSLALSPVCPLGTSSAIAAVDQNLAVATVRNTEVVSDSTNVLALECAVRRRDLMRSDPKSAEPVHLAASHRLLRAQFYDNPSMLAHFSTFVLCSAGRDQGGEAFNLSALGTHIRFYLRALRAFLGRDISLRLAVTDFSGPARRSQLEFQLLAPLRAGDERVQCALDDARTAGKGYYLDLCFHIYATDSSGAWLELVDGGAVDWTQRLLSNAKERLVISGIGSERLCSAFGSVD